MSFQDVITLIDYNSTINNGSSLQGEGIACIGYTKAYGLIYSDQNVTLTIEQGTNDKSGSLTYRYTNTIAVTATVASIIEVKIYGKFIRATISNSSGSTANVEVFIALRGNE